MRAATQVLEILQAHLAVLEVLAAAVAAITINRNTEPEAQQAATVRHQTLIGALEEKVKSTTIPISIQHMHFIRLIAIHPQQHIVQEVEVALVMLVQQEAPPVQTQVTAEAELADRHIILNTIPAVLEEAD